MANKNGEAVSPGLWYFVGKPTPQIGAYLPDYSGDLTLYWRGKVNRGALRTILEETEKALAGTIGGKYSTTLDTYNANTSKTEIHTDVAPLLSKYISAPELKNFETCRVEVTSAAQTIVIWANVSGKPTASLEQGGETIGLTIPQKLAFDGPLRPVLVNAISRTLAIGEEQTRSFLSSISKAISNRQLHPSG